MGETVKINLNQYAERHGLKVEDVKQALEATGQTTHPTKHIEDISAIDKLLGVLTVAEDKSTEEAPAKESEDAPSMAQVEKAEESEGTLSASQIEKLEAEAESVLTQEPPEEDPAVPPIQEETVQTVRTAKKVFGDPGEGKHLFELRPNLGQSEVPDQLYRAYGYDESEAIGAVVSGLPVKNAAKVNWSVRRLEQKTLVD